MLRRRTASRSKAFVSFDAMFSIIPALVMLLFVLNITHLLTDNAAQRMHRQETFDKLVSVADYVVKQGAVKTDEFGKNERHPNWLDSAKVDGALADGLRQKTGLSELSIALDSPGSGPVCIYRIVVVDDTQRIAQLYVCGG